MTEYRCPSEIELEDKIRETANEVQDGQMETWIHNNHLDLVKEFVEDNLEFEDFCKDRWREVNE